MREVRTIDGWVDADYRPARRPAHRLPSADVAARRLKLAEFILDYQARQGCKLEAALEAAMAPTAFGCTRKHALAALREYRLGLAVETATYVGPQGSRAVHRVRGRDGRWREVPNAPISSLSDLLPLDPTSGDSDSVADEPEGVVSMMRQEQPEDRPMSKAEEHVEQGAQERVILRPAEVVALGYASSMSALTRAIKAKPPRFPLPIRLGPRSVGYRRAELDAWLASQEPIT